MKNKLVAPIVKWVGGKRQLISEISKFIPKKFNKYYEPFIGGGAVLFHLQPKEAVINDVNEELINMYKVIKDNLEELIYDLKQHKIESDYFYDLRELDRDKNKYDKLNPVQRASRIIYLNKTCYNGLFRVNRAGEFNTPWGNYKNPNVVNEITLKAVSNYLNKSNITLLNKDFSKSLKGIKKGSFVYFDPPYDPVSTSASFTGYSKGGFDKEEQIRLKNIVDQLNNMDVKILLSNSNTPFIMDLYKDYKIEIVQAKRAINSKADLRGEVEEVLVRNYD